MEIKAATFLKRLTFRVIAAFLLLLSLPAKAQTTLDQAADTAWPMYQHDPLIAHTDAAYSWALSTNLNCSGPLCFATAQSRTAGWPSLRTAALIGNYPSTSCRARAIAPSTPERLPSEGRTMYCSMPSVITGECM